MRKGKYLTITRLLMLLAIILIIISSISNIVVAENTITSPKNVILLIGDGMGPNQVLMAHDIKGSNLYMEDMPYKGMLSTVNAVGGVTDSAAAGTALATGAKTRNSYLGMNEDEVFVSNIREFCVRHDKMTGIISTVKITDATPAAFYAHNVVRTEEALIKKQLIESNIDVIIGPGAQNYSTPNNLVTGEMESLEKATILAIEFLDKGENGFFLMVEGGKIDHAGHSNSIEQCNYEVLEFDKAVKAALEFAEKDGSTLVIVTADHETGGLQKSNTSYKFTSPNHTGVDVPVFAFGVGASYFTGRICNTEISLKIKRLILGDSLNLLPTKAVPVAAGIAPETVVPEAQESNNHALWIGSFSLLLLCAGGIGFYILRKKMEGKL